MKNGLLKIKPHKEDYSFLHTFGAISGDQDILPANFSIYSGQPIPNQEAPDTRFANPLPPLPYGCTGESGAFDCEIQDGVLYNPQDLYLSTPPGGPGGRDLRDMLKTLINRGPLGADGNFGPRRVAFFNCYGSGKIDDFDAVRLALWVNQFEKRGVYVGSWWYPEFESPVNGSLPVPSFNTQTASLHCHLVTGWRTNADGTVELQDISWQGSDYGNAGVVWISRDIFNKLMAQPYTGAFTITKDTHGAPIPVGLQAYYDHVIYAIVNFIRNLWGYAS